MKWLRKWLYSLFFMPAGIQTVIMTEAEVEKEKTERQLWEEKQIADEKGETDVVS